LCYRENYSHGIRRKTATPKAIFFVFLFHPFPFPSLYHECNPRPLLRSYKRGAGATSRDIEETTHTHLARTKHMHIPLKRDLGSAPSLESF
jgi:hypothetical protein